MNKISKQEILWYGLFFGGVWGFLEATLGYILNMFPSGISGGIMFPVAYILMNKAYNKTNSLKVVSLMTVVTAFIKLTNLALPYLPAVKVINPAFAILLEGFSIVILFKLTLSNDKKITLLPVFLTCMIWRALYLADVTILYYLNIPSRMIERGLYSILEYLMLGIVNTFLIAIFVKLKRENPGTVNPVNTLNPVFSAAAVTAGIAFQFIVRM